MKLFYQLFGYILLGIIVVHGVEEFHEFWGEVKQFERDMIDDAAQDGKSLSGIIQHVWNNYGEEETIHIIKDANIADNQKLRLVWLQDIAGDFAKTQVQKEQFAKLKNGEIISLEQRDQDGLSKRYTYVPLDLKHPQQGALEISQGLLPLKQYTTQKLKYSIVVSVILAVAFGIILYFFIDKKIRTPLNALMRQAHEIGQGNLGTTQVLQGSDELANLAKTMNEMSASLRHAREKIKSENDARIEALEQLRHSEKLSTVGQISADIAHEIGTPLNVIDGRAKMILTEDRGIEDMHNSASIIRNQTQKITKTIRQLLDFSRRPQQQIDSQNIASLTKQAFQLLQPIASKQRVVFQLHAEDNVQSIIKADHSQIQQVLINHLMNSIHAMPDGGKIVVDLSNEILPSNTNTSHDSNNFLKIRITDEGAGIDKNHLKDIFTPFFTTKNVGEGTGLGLSISHGIIKDHNGWIEVENIKSKGTCFNIYIPLEQQ